MKKPLYEQLATLVDAHHRCVRRTAAGESHLAEWIGKHKDRADALVKQHLPRGGGFDSGTKLDWDLSYTECLAFRTSFHHMDGETGMYTEWTEHIVRVRASLLSHIVITIDGRNLNEIKDYIHEAFDIAIREEVEQPE